MVSNSPPLTPDSLSRTLPNSFSSSSFIHFANKHLLCASCVLILVLGAKSSWSQGVCLWGDRQQTMNRKMKRECAQYLLDKYVLYKVKVKVTQSCPTLCYPMDCPWNSPHQNTGVGSLSLLQGIFPTRGSTWGLLHCKQILYQLSSQGSPTCCMESCKK